mmetsp:Transcript_1987/g.3498  ORF Transcript_1987/g.3498 Transcript_1987/m.3498 type:complete len:140 (-) Transcript_1987:43-462(-)
MREYVMEIQRKEFEKNLSRRSDMARERELLKNIREQIDSQKQKELSLKREKQTLNVRNFDSVKQERDSQIQRESQERIQPQQEYFPFTHGDVIEAARAQVREEMLHDLKQKQIIWQSQRDEKLRMQEAEGASAEEEGAK